MYTEQRRVYHRTVAEYTATVLWYFEALLIGIILAQFEGRFKHFLLVIRIIHTSRSFLQKQHHPFFFWRPILVSCNKFLIYSYLVFSFWFLLFAFFYDNVAAIRCIYLVFTKSVDSNFARFDWLP